MNNDSSFSIIGDEPVEARIVAWVLGEASAFEAEELERLCAERPELLVFKRRMRALHGLLTEAEASQPDTGWTLPPEKRKALDEVFGDPLKVDAAPVVERRVRRAGVRAALAIAACLVAAVVILQLVHPVIVIQKSQRALEKHKTDNYLNDNIEVRPFDAESVAKAKQGLDYRKPSKEIAEEERQKKAEERRKKQSQDVAGTTEVKTPPDFRALGKILTWIFIAIAIGLIVWLVMRAIKEGNIFSPANKKIKLDGETIDIEHIEENLAEIGDLDPVIQQAIRQGNYTLAIRLYYLAILKALTENNAISWKRDKTNRAYVEEMRNHTFFEPFRHTTRLFERAWYGNSNLQVVDFERIRPDFDQLLRGVKNLNANTLKI